MHMYEMESYCLKCTKNTENIDPKVSASSNGRVMILSKCAMCGTMKKKPGFNGYFYDFSVDYDPIAVDDIKSIHKYLMKKNDIM